MANRIPAGGAAGTTRAVILFGPPGSGKGTLGRALGALPGFEHYDMGGALRAVNPESDRGRRIREHVDAGELLPHELVHEVFFDDLERLALEGRHRPGEDLLILDGLPRTPVQYRTLGERLDLTGVISLEVADRETLLERLRQRARHERRSDDADPDAVAARIERFEREAESLWPLFPDGEVHAVDAGRDPLAVLGGAVNALAALLEPAKASPRVQRFSWARFGPHALACLLYTALGGIVASGCRVTDMRQELLNCQVNAREQVATIERQQSQNVELNRRLRTVYSWVGLMREGETSYPATLEALRTASAGGPGPSEERAAEAPTGGEDEDAATGAGPRGDDE